MDIFFAFVTLLNAIALIATGYLVWNVGEIFDRKLADAIRKQDDRIRKRAGSAANGQQATEETGSEVVDQPEHRPAKGRAGRPFRRS